MKRVRSWLAIIAILGFVFAQNASAVQPVDVGIRYSESTNGSISANGSSLQAQEHSHVSPNPKVIVIGKGYNASHPFNYSSQFGKQTWIKNVATGVSMNHQVGSTNDLSQTLEMSAKDSRQKSDSGTSGYSGMQMKLSEDVQEGKVSIGVLQGSIPGIGQTPSASALRKPLIEIDEEYVGTFHIEKNMSIQVPFGQIWQNYSWLPCYAEDYYDIAQIGGKHINLERIFDSTKDY